jgi:hypothetical protein
MGLDLAPAAVVEPVLRAAVAIKTALVGFRNSPEQARLQL